jgi:hypothetical protein
MHPWPFSFKENGAAINPPLHSNREIALEASISLSQTAPFNFARLITSFGGAGGCTFAVGYRPLTSQGNRQPTIA